MIPPFDQIELSLPVPAGGQINSEQVMFMAGQDYHAQLETYAHAVRDLHHALVSKPAPWGWWSWTAYYFGLSQETALSNAQWLSEHLKDLGFDFFHFDAGYAYADGEYTTANAILFPDGMQELGHKVCQLGFASCSLDGSVQSLRTSVGLPTPSRVAGAQRRWETNSDRLC